MLEFSYKQGSQILKFKDLDICLNKNRKEFSGINTILYLKAGMFGHKKIKIIYSEDKYLRGFRKEKTCHNASVHQVCLSQHDVLGLRAD